MLDFYKAIAVGRDADSSTIKKATKTIKLKIDSDIRAILDPYEDTEKEVTDSDQDLVDSLEEKLDLIREIETTLLDHELRDKYDLSLLSISQEDLEDNYEDVFELDEPIDFASFRKGSDKSWRTLLTQNEKGIEIFKTILRRIVHLPFPDIQESILLAALLTPSASCSQLPIIFAQGVSGSGKSSIGKFAGLIWDCQPLVGATTAAALRRTISTRSTLEHNGKKYEKNHVLIWDDISTFLIKNEMIKSLIKSGTDRETSVILISKKGSDTKVEPFQCFGMRIISSVEPFYSDPELIELNRRFLIFECRKNRNFTPINTSSYDWKGFTNIINKFWNRENLATFRDANDALTKAMETNSLSIPVDRFIISRDVLAAGMTLKLFLNANDALIKFKAFIDQNDKLISDGSNPMGDLLDRYIDLALSQKNKRMDTSAVKAIIESGVHSGVIERPKWSDVTRYLKSKNFQVDTTLKAWIYKDEKQ